MVDGFRRVRAARSQKVQSWKGSNTIDTRERASQKRQKTRRDIQRRTRRSASTIGGAAPDTIIGRAVADRAELERVPTVPHVAKTRLLRRRYANTPTRRHASLTEPILNERLTIICETVNQGFFAEMLSIRPRSGYQVKTTLFYYDYFGSRGEINKPAKHLDTIHQ